MDPEQLLQQKRKNEILTDSEVIKAIETCITEGINTKIKLTDAAAEFAKISKRKVHKIIEKYTGDKWSFVVGARGAQFYKLLEHPSVDITAI